MPKSTVWTIGHSDLTLAAFEKELQANGIKMLVDVRSLTGSKAFPQFDEDKLKPALAKAGIRYIGIPKLGGRRNRDYAIDQDENGAWLNTSFKNYADYATTAAFRAGLNQLQKLAHAAPTAYMCSEAVWWRCHRRIISDHLLALGWSVQNIMSATETDAATYNPGAKVDPKTKMVTYPGTAWAKAHPRAAADSQGRSKRATIGASTHTPTGTRHGNKEAQ